MNKETLKSLALFLKNNFDSISRAMDDIHSDLVKYPCFTEKDAIKHIKENLKKANKLYSTYKNKV